ncbi:MAG: hypothetical protein HOW73_03750 [Polyangiaceae bacterium]|nr:hypothetical protein [Polyangiaceae bacterium]
MATARSNPPLSADRLAAVCSRFDALTAQTELRVAKAWEAAELARHAIGLGIVAGESTDCEHLLGAANQAAGAAALASSPRASDLVLGRVRAEHGGRAIEVSHERRPIDPMDYFGAFATASLTKDAAVLAALARVAEDVEPDPAPSSRVSPERALFRAAFAALTAWAREVVSSTGSTGSRNARAAAEDAIRQIEEGSALLDEFRALRLQSLVVPLLACVSTGDEDAAVAHALDEHARYFSDPRRADDPSGFVPWGPLALASLRGFDPGRFPWRTAEPAEGVRALLSFLQRPARAVSLFYDVPEVQARSLDDARLRVELSSPGTITVAETVEPGPMRVSMEARDTIVVRYTFLIDDVDGRWLVDAGELVHLAEREREKMRAPGAHERDRANARVFGKRCAASALALLGNDDELFRDRMTSPLGRALCDDYPHKFTRSALSALVASFDDAGSS